MHKSGKILIWVIVVVILFGAIPLSVKMVGVQTSWTRQVAEVHTSNEQLADELAEKELTLQKLNSELAQVKLGMERYWNGPPVQVLDNTQGIFAAGVGTQHGLRIATTETPTGVQQVPPLLYLFRPTPEGGFLYVGEFEVIPEALADNTCRMKATWKLRPEEVQQFNGFRAQQQVAWRIRTQIPAAAKLRFDELYNRAHKNERELQSKERNIRRQRQLKALADEELIVRRGELLGNPNATPVAGRPEFSVGLVQAIEDEEELRNALQLDVDLLRRDIRNTSNERDRLNQDNIRLTGELPQPSRLSSARQD